MSRFALHSAYPRALQRVVAASGVALMAALGLAIASAPSASAATGDASDSYVTFSWLTPYLSDDANSNGIADPGDAVVYPLRITALAENVRITTLRLGAATFFFGVDLSAGSSQEASYSVGVGSNPDPITGGPLVDAGSFDYTHGAGATAGTLAFGAPAPFQAPRPLTVSTTFAMTENHGSVAGQLVEGDQVHYVTHVTNTSAVAVTLTGSGYTSPALPLSLAAGASVDLLGADVGVTYDHMVAGGVSFADASVGWAGGGVSGTVPVTVGTAPTEAIDDSFIADVDTVVHTAGGGVVALGDAAAGDRIDYTFQLQNTGNFDIRMVGLRVDPRPGIDGMEVNWNYAAALPQGASLPSGFIGAANVTSIGGFWPAYTLTQADIDLGYVDIGFATESAPSVALYQSNPSAYNHALTKRTYLRVFTTGASVTYTKAQLNDTNGDGIGQAGETVTYRAEFQNLSNQNLVIDSVDDLTDPYVSGPVATAFVGSTLAPSGQAATEWNYTITSADEARGTLDAGVRVAYTGQADGATASRDGYATITTGTYVAPATTLDTSATYGDANGDGHPSIGETVTYTVTVANTGAWGLTGLTVADAAGADVTGLLPTFSTSIAAGTSESQTFTHVITAADFARGSLWYGTEMTATGAPTTQSGTSVTLTGITFQAYATDLDGVAEGGVAVCLPTGVATTTITMLDTIWVKPASCDYVGSADGYRVVAFSSPVTLGVDTFAVKVPATLGVGAHRLALYAPDGTLVGWASVTAKDPIALAGPGAAAGGLAHTGSDAGEVRSLVGGAAALVLLGAATLFALARRRRSSAP